MDFLSLLQEERKRARAKGDSLDSKGISNNIITTRSINISGINIDWSFRKDIANSNNFSDFISRYHISSGSGNNNNNNNNSSNSSIYNTIYYIPSLISADNQSSIITLLHESQWTTLKTRQLQCYGNSNNDNDSNGDSTTVNGRIPLWMEGIIDHLVAIGIFPQMSRPNHVLVNRYSPNQGILHHVDGPKYTPIVAILSLMSPCMISFKERYSQYFYHSSS